MEKSWHSLKLDEVFKSLETSPEGLLQSAASGRLKRYGPNQIAEPEQVSAIKILIGELTGFFNIILFFSAFVALSVGFLPGHIPKYHEVIFIFAIIILNTIISFIEEYKAARSIQSLHKVIKIKAKVLRDGRESKIDSSEIVPGDILILSEGDKAPADGRITEGFGLKVDESVLTGESVSVDKSNKEVPQEAILAERTDMVYSGTYVTRGNATVAVTATGMSTEIGKIATDLYEITEQPTSFQLEVAKLGKQITITITAIVAVIAVTYYFFEHLSFYDVLINSISLGVAAVPASLPVVMTFALAMGTRKMLEKNALVRHLSVVESLGSVDVICTDKTGTLTENRMTVQKIYVFDGMSKTEAKVTGFDTQALSLLLRASVLCNEAEISTDEKDHETYLGDPTEISLLLFANEKGLNPQAMREKYPKISEIPFSSETKRMTTIHKIDEKTVAYSKGALSAILNDCDHILKGTNRVPLTSGDREKIMAAADSMAGEALRVLAFSCKEMLSAEAPEQDVEKGMVFLGLEGMMDPPRKEVKQSIQIANNAGIKIVMITGDNKKTAQAIAGEVGIGSNAVEGRDIDKHGVEELSRDVETIDIVARATPQTKYKITQALQKNGHYVAMTGDGVNDATAIKQSDVGIAMGLRGTDVAKESSDMILLDDNFKTIVDAVEEGRRIFDNIKKFVNYLLSANLSEVFVILILSFFGYIPLTGIMVLWVNMVTDILPASALAVDPANPGIIRRQPRKAGEPVLNRGVKTLIAFSGIKKVIVLLIIFYIGLRMGGVQLAQTMVFTSVILFSFVRIMIVRQMDKLSIWSNKWLLFAIAAGISLQLLVLYTPFLRDFFNVIPLGYIHWAILLPIVFFSAFLGVFGARIIMKYVPAI
jgi:P-type Ca2+ transporter type 2C